MKQSFDRLLFEVKKDIKIITAEELIDFLTGKYYDYEELLKNCTSHNDVFKELSEYYSFFSYDLMEHIAKQFGSAGIKKEMKRYKQKFQKYAKRRVCECPSVYGDARDSEKVFKIKIEADIGSMCANEVKRYEKELQDILGHRSLCLLEIKDGCVELIFRAVEDNDEFVINEYQHIQLRKIGVITISYGDESICIKTNEATDRSSICSGKNYFQIKIAIRVWSLHLLESDYYSGPQSGKTSSGSDKGMYSVRHTCCHVVL